MIRFPTHQRYRVLFRLPECDYANNETLTGFDFTQYDRASVLENVMAEIAEIEKSSESRIIVTLTS